MRFLAVVLSLFLSATALADSIDQLGQALMDRSMNVRAQAAIVLGKLKDRRGVPLLVRALGDKEVAVRVVAAASLGKIGDPEALPALRAKLSDSEAPVRTAVGRAIAAIENPSDVSQVGPQTGPSRFALELGPTVGSQGAADAARFAYRELATHIGRIRGVSLNPAPGLTRYFVDTKIAKLQTTPPDARGRVQIECDISVIVASHPDRSIKMMATVGGSLEEPNEPKGVADAKNFCLGDAAKQAAEKIQTYLQGVR